MLCVLFVVAGTVEAKQENTDRKPQHESPVFETKEETSTLLFRVVDQEQVAITTTSAIYKIVVESNEETPTETESPWTKKFWKERIEQINEMLFKK